MLAPPAPPQAIRLPGQAAHEPSVGQGFAVAVPWGWRDPATPTVGTWTERRGGVQSAAHARPQHAGLHARLAQGQAARSALNAKPASDGAGWEPRARAILPQSRVRDYLSLSVRARVTGRTA